MLRIVRTLTGHSRCIRRTGKKNISWLTGNNRKKKYYSQQAFRQATCQFLVVGSTCLHFYMQCHRCKIQAVGTSHVCYFVQAGLQATSLESSLRAVFGKFKSLELPSVLLRAKSFEHLLLTTDASDSLAGKIISGLSEKKSFGKYQSQQMLTIQRAVP